MSAARSETIDRLLTREDLLAMGDIGPCELIDGRIVAMSPTGVEHGEIETRLALLGNLVAERRLGRVVGGEVAIYIRRNPDRIRAADLAFWSKTRMPGKPSRKFADVAPELVAEILSPDDRWEDIRQKIEEHFSIGVERVWIVEPQNRAVEVFRSAAESQRLTAADSLRGEGVLEGFTLPVAGLFEE